LPQRDSAGWAYFGKAGGFRVPPPLLNVGCRPLRARLARAKAGER